MVARLVVIFCVAFVFAIGCIGSRFSSFRGDVRGRDGYREFKEFVFVRLFVRAYGRGMWVRRVWGGGLEELVRIWGGILGSF